jgi:hypothetical protein
MPMSALQVNSADYNDIEVSYDYDDDASTDWVPMEGILNGADKLDVSHEGREFENILEVLFKQAEEGKTK